MMSEDKGRFKIAVISFSVISEDARVLRQVTHLSRNFCVDVIGYGDLDPSPQVTFRKVAPDAPTGVLRKVRTFFHLVMGTVVPGWAYERLYWGKSENKTALSMLVKSDPHAIHANDWNALPVAARASEKTGARVVLDLHEYAPGEFENRWYWRRLYRPMVDYLIKKYVSSISASVTVGPMIAERYAEGYGFRPMVIMNIPKASNASEPNPTDPDHIRLVHHGRAIRDRKLESMIRTMVQTDSRFTLHFMLLESSPGYIRRLKALADRLAPGRIFFHDPVKPQAIVDRISEFDMGIHLLPSHSYNLKAALTNKFFDFVMAGLPVCIGPSPEMVKLTRQLGLGIVSDNLEPNEVAGILNSLTAEDIDRMKSKALEAREILGEEAELGKLTELYAGMSKTVPAKRARRPRVGILLRLPTPYREPMWKHLAASDEVDIEVIYCSKSQPDREWAVEIDGFAHRFLRGLQLTLPSGGSSHTYNFNPSIWWLLSRARFDVLVVSGYADPTMQIAALWSWVHRTPYLVMSETHLLNRRSRLVRAVKRVAVKPLVRRATAWFPTGTVAKDHLTFYGGATDRMFFLPNTCDVEHIATEASRAAVRKQEILAELDLNVSQLLLYVGRLVGSKEVHVLIRAFAAVKDELPGLGLLIVGEGPNRRSLENLCDSLAVDDVRFLGFRQHGELPRYYGAADALVLPSSFEPWGVVINEAMASSLPIIASRMVGAAWDLVNDGENGFIVKEGDVEGLSDSIRALFSLEESDRKAMGARSKEMVSRRDYAYAADQFLKAVRVSIDNAASK